MEREKTYKTELERELEKALDERGISFIETSREQLERFVQADLEKYPEYKQLLGQDPGDGDLHQDFLMLAKKAIEAGTTIPETPARFEIASRLLHEAFNMKRGTYKTRTAMVNDFIVEYRVIINPVDDPEEAYAEKDVHEFISINKQLDEQAKKLIVFQYNNDLELYSIEIMDDIDDHLEYSRFDSFIEYQDNIEEYRKNLEGMKESAEMPDPPELNAKKFTEDLMKLIGE